MPGNVKVLVCRLVARATEPVTAVADNFASYSGTTEASYNFHGNYLWPFRIFWMRWELVGRYDVISYSN